MFFMMQPQPYARQPTFTPTQGRDFTKVTNVFYNENLALFTVASIHII